MDGHYWNCYKLLGLFTSVKHVHLDLWVVDHKNVEDAEDGNTKAQEDTLRNQITLWNVFIGRQCTFDITLTVHHMWPVDEASLGTLLKMLRHLSVKETALKSSSLSRLDAVYTSLDSLSNAAKALETNKHLNIRPQFSPQLKHNSLFTLTHIETSLSDTSGLSTLLSILRSTSITLRSLTLAQCYMSEPTAPSLVIATTKVELPSLRNLQVNVDAPSLHLLKCLSAPSLQHVDLMMVINLSLLNTLISDYKVQLLKFLGTANALITVRAQCLYTNMHGEWIAKFLRQFKEGLNASIKYDIDLRFINTSWADEMENPAIQQYLLPMQDHIVKLQETMGTCKSSNRIEACKPTFPRLQKYDLSITLCDDIVYNLQHHLDMYKFPCVADFGLDVYLPEDEDDDDDHDGQQIVEVNGSAMSALLGLVWGRFPVWPCLETFRYECSHSPDTEHVKDEACTQDLLKACHRFGIKLTVND